jgi:signal transduction histidine kinase
VFSRFVQVFGVFSFGVIVLAALIWLLYRALRRSRVQEQDSADFSRITMRAQERERAFISAELHDTVLQDMGRLLQISKENIPNGNAPLAELAGKVLIRTREICRELMPPDFSRLALADMLVQLCADFEKRASVECRAVIDKDFSADRLSPQTQLQVYRIVQEALSNIEKHAEAAEVTLLARNKEDALLICVTDDGKGISPAIAGGEGSPRQSGQGLGIRGMYQRASMIGASLSFIPGAGSGLTVRLEAPFS